MQWVIDRLKESSTWKGLISLLTAFGITIEPGLAEAIVAAGLGLMGVISILVKDKTKVVATPAEPPKPAEVAVKEQAAIKS